MGIGMEMKMGMEMDMPEVMAFLMAISSEDDVSSISTLSKRPTNCSRTSRALVKERYCTKFSKHHVSE